MQVSEYIKIKPYLTALLIWRVKHLSKSNFLIILSVVVGLLTGLAAVFLKNLVGFVERIVVSWGVESRTNFWYLALPLIGIVLTVVCLQQFIKDDIGHGITKVLRAISKGNGFLRRSKTYSSMITSALTVGLGGSVGLEAPIVLTGASIGSNLGRMLRLDYRAIVLLIGCGATGAVAGIFKAPVAGILFTLEVLMLDLTMASLVPLLLCSVTATVVSSTFLGSAIQFTFDIGNADYGLDIFPYLLLLGLFAGGISLYFTGMSHVIEVRMKQWSNPWTKAILGGILLSIVIYIFPPLFGEGFLHLSDIITGQSSRLTNDSFFYAYKDDTLIFLIFLLLVLFMKVIAMSLTTGSGGVGGVFAPSLFMGGIVGLFTARLCNMLFDVTLSEPIFALTGMAGVMAGVMHAPLTAIFLIAEITGGYKLFIPLIIVATISYLVHRHLQPYSIYARDLAERGELLTHDKDKSVLTMMRIDRLIETNFVLLYPDNYLRDVVNAMTVSSRNFFPVVDSQGLYLGVVAVDDIRQMIFKQELYDKIKVTEIMHRPPISIDVLESMATVAQKFQQSDQFNIVVLENQRYVGFLSQSHVFAAYQSLLHQLSEE
ncbi:chloride channel protein [Bacteroidia bacterium]|nr:chloride channel protein [Bacteroidia bacterium]